MIRIMLNYFTMKANDLLFLFELYVATRSDEIATWGWDEAQQTAFLQMQFAAQQRSYAMQFPGAAHQILQVDGQAVGRVLVWRSATEIRLVDIALLPAFRSRGLGSQTIQALQAEATASGQPLRLSVLRNSPARRLYDRLGFVVTQENEPYLAMEWIP